MLMANPHICSSKCSQNAEAMGHWPILHENIEMHTTIFTLNLSEKDH